MLKNDLEEYGIISSLQTLNILDCILYKDNHNINIKEVIRDCKKELYFLKHQIREGNIEDVSTELKKINTKIIKKYTKGVEQCLN